LKQLCFKVGVAYGLARGVSSTIDKVPDIF